MLKHVFVFWRGEAAKDRVIYTHTVCVCVVYMSLVWREDEAQPESILLHICHDRR